MPVTAENKQREHTEKKKKSNLLFILILSFIHPHIHTFTMSDDAQRNPVPESNMVKTEEVIDASDEEVAKSQALMQAVAEGKVETVEKLLKDGANHR